MSPFWTSAFLDLARDDFARGVLFWAEVTGYRVSSPRGDSDEFATLVPPRGDAFLRVQKLAVGPSRIHLDLHVPDPQVAAEEAVALGARVVHRSERGYVVVASPGGFVHCLVAHPVGVRPAPAVWPGGASVVDQVCLDIPPDGYDEECAFWQAVTGWELREAGPEFRRLVRPPGMPLNLLLQRLDDPAEQVRAHLDLSSTDRRAETARHERLGARVESLHEHWTVLTDPAGSAYCITVRHPETGLLP
jgi:hypothetical protein